MPVFPVFYCCFIFAKIDESFIVGGWRTKSANMAPKLSADMAPKSNYIAGTLGPRPMLGWHL